MRICKQKMLFYRVLSIVLLVALLQMLLVSCQDDVDCYRLAESFRDECGTGGVIYSPRIPEGNEGYVADDFFILMYSEENTHAADFAVLISQRGDIPREAAFFLCHSEYDALSVELMLKSRLALIAELFGAGNGSPANGGFVLRSGRVVAMCATDDNGEARGIVKMLIG